MAKVFAAVLGLVVGLVLCLVIAGATDERPEAPTVTVELGERVSPEEPTLELDYDNDFERADAEEADDAPLEEGPGVHEDLRDETPPGAPEDAAKRINRSPMAGRGPPLPVGGAQNYSCTRRPVRNFSERASGSRVGLFVLHYAVIRPVPNALTIIRNLFDRPSFGASSHLGLHPDGRCELWVDFSRKAWTQGAFNSASESVEIMAFGDEPRSWWLAQPIIKRGILAAIVADRLRARGLPPRRVDPGGCGVQNAGWTDHDALECSNTHHDVKPAFPYDVLQAQIVRLFNAVSSALPGPRPKPAWFWDACDSWLGGDHSDLAGPQPKPPWFWKACDAWAVAH